MHGSEIPISHYVPCSVTRNVLRTHTHSHNNWSLSHRSNTGLNPCLINKTTNCSTSMATHIDLDLPACGLYAFVYWGLYTELCCRPGFVVDRVYGRSSGAIVGACILSLPPECFDEICARVKQYNTTMYIVDSWCRALYEFLPVDAYARCTNRLFVTSAIMGCIPSTTSVFRDNTHLIEMLYASGSIPFVTTGARVTFSGGWPLFDGFFIDWLYGSQKRHQLRDHEASTHQHYRLCIPRPTYSTSRWPDRIPVSMHSHSMSAIQASVDVGRSLMCTFLAQHPEPTGSDWLHIDGTV